MALSAQYTDKLVDKIFNGTAYTFTPFISLHTSDPGLTGSNEVSGGGYARVNASSPQIFGNPPSAGALLNTVAVAFNNLPACTVVYFGVFDAATAGNFVCGGVLRSPIAVASGQTVTCAPSQLSIGFDDTSNPTAWAPYLRDLVLAYSFQATAFSIPTFYMSLHNGAPGTNGANELNGGPGPYARQTVAFGVSTNGQNANTGQVLFSGLPGASLSYIGLWDAATGGNFLVSAPVTTTTVVNTGDTAQFAVGAFDNLLT